MKALTILVLLVIAGLTSCSTVKEPASQSETNIWLVVPDAIYDEYEALQDTTDSYDYTNPLINTQEQLWE